MAELLRFAFRKVLPVFFLLAGFVHTNAQTTVFSDDFTISRGTTFTSVNGPVGTSPTWSMLRSGSDFGAGINAGRMVLTNDATGTFSLSNGWVLAYTSAAAFGTPYNATLANNPGQVTWTFNMRQIRSNPSGPAAGYYANAFILAGTSNTTATTGSGYAVILGNSGSTDPLRLIRYTAGIRTSTNIISSNTSGLTDFGNQYLSVKVVYTPTTNTWQLYVRNDGTAFQDPAAGNLTLQGSVVNNGSTAGALPLLGAYWNGNYNAGQTAFFDNIKVTVALPVITSISPTSKVANTGGFTLTVNGSNFTPASLVRWNGSNRTTTYVSPTQLTATIGAADIATSGTAAITVATGVAVSNSVTFVIDPAGVPSISTSISALPGFTTVTGTASASQSFTVTGANLTADVSVAAPANFEVSVNNTTWADNLTLLRTGNVLTGQPVTVYTRLKASAPAGLYASNITFGTTGGASKQVAVSGTVLAAEPATSAVLGTFTNVTSSGFTINFTAGSGTNRLVVVRQGSAVNATPADGTAYTAAAVFGSGSELGTGNYVVYNGTGTSVNVSGLSPATTYHVAVYEFNGTGGTQNYKITAPAIGNRATINAPLGLQITAANTVSNIDFDNTVDGVNNGTFNGGGINAVAGLGELSSNSWAFTGFSGGSIAFGGSSPEDSSYENGASEGDVEEGGLYAFEVAPDNFALGVKPAAGEFAPGTITFRFQNQTGVAINSISIGYKVYVRNNEAGSSSFNFSHSGDNLFFATITALNETTVAAPDPAPGWKAYYKVVTITGLAVPSNLYYYLRWSGATVSGTAFDEIALDDISIVINPTTNFANFSGSAETFVVAGNANLSGATDVAGNITFLNNSRIAIGSNTFTLNGPVTNTTTGGLRGSASSNLVIGGTGTRTLSFDQTTVGTTNLLGSLSIGTTGSTTTTLGNALAVNTNLTINEGQTFNLGTNALTGTLTAIDNSGTLTTQNTTATPFTAGRTWGGIGTVALNAASAAQTLPAGIYNNVTVSTTGGGNAGSNLTINGNLFLPNSNVSATKGAFDTAAFAITMGPNAANTGVGDVSGTVTRTSIASNILYTFGHPQTNIFFPAVGTLPTSLSLRTTLGQAPAGKTDGILRTYDFIRSAMDPTAPATKAIIRAHYLDSELNGNNEQRLVDWVVVTSPAAVLEQGRSNFNTTDNYVELSNVDIRFFDTSFNAKRLTLANSQNAVAVWNGSVSDSWITSANWTPNAVPSSITKVIIPNAATTNNDPLIDANANIGTLTVETGGIINSPANSTFTISGSAGAWINNGTFNPGTNSNVVFNATTADATIAGNTTFNNLIVASGTILRALNDNYIRLTGTFTKTGTFIAGAVRNTFEYAGTNQTIVVPNGASSAYYNLTISGTGAVVPSALNLGGSLITNTAVNFANTTVSLIGADNDTQLIGGTVSPVLNNLVVNMANGRAGLGNDVTVGGTLTLSSGLLYLYDNDLTLGANAVAGTFSTTSMIVADGDGVVRRPFTGTGSYLFPIGEVISNTTYSPITVNITAGTFSNAYVAVNLRDAVHPNNYSTPAYLTRYWNVTQTGIANAVATITASYVTGDAVGGEAALAAAQLNGTFNVQTNPWVKFAPLSGNTLVAAGVVLTPGQVSAFTGITRENVTATIAGTGTFCQNDVVTLTAQVTGGATPYTYSWSGGLGTASTATPPTATAGTVSYTLTVRDANGIAATDTKDITVTNPPVAGTLSGNQQVCANSPAAPITLTGYTGTIVRWERAALSNFSSPVFINNTTATLSPAEIGQFTSTRYIRAVIQNGSCPVVYTAPVEIQVVSTTWNGTAWSNGAPTATTGVIFTGDYTATGNIDACNIQVANGAVVTIPGGNTVTLNGIITVSSGSFTLENNANLIQLTNAANSGNIIVKRDSSPLYRLDYTMWSSPVTGSKTMIEFSPETSASRFLIYNPANNLYAPIATSSTFTPGVGYLIRMPNGDATPGYNTGASTLIFTGVFDGVPNNGNVTRALGGASGTFHFIGNPYPSPIDIPQFLNGNQNAIDGTLWVWRKKNNPTSVTSAYVTINSTGQYVGNGEPEQENPNGILRTAQGFIVRVKTGNLTNNVTFTNTMRSSNTGNQFFRNSNTVANLPESHGIWLNLTNSSGFFSQMYTGYIAGATQGEDYGIDSRYINDSPTVLAAKIGTEEFIIQGRALPFAANDVVPLIFRTAAAGMYTITIDHVDGLFTAGQQIYLKDNLTGMVHELTASAYTFTTGTGTFDTRFEVMFTNTTLGIDKPVISTDEVIVYKQDKLLHVTSGNIMMNDITVYDTRGRLLYQATGINASQFAIDGLVAQEQMLIIDISTEKGKVSKKVIY